MSVILENRLQRLQVFNLEHESFCKDGECSCSTTLVKTIEYHPRTGEKGSRLLKRLTPKSLTLLALERRSGLPAAVLTVPDVARAIFLKQVRVVEQAPAVKPVIRAAAVPAATPAR